MKRKPVWIFVETLVLLIFLRAESTYVFSYYITGEVTSRTLIFIPLRVFYEASASVVFRAERLPSGNERFRSIGIGGTGYVLRTLGFSGRSLALLTADNDRERSGTFAERKLADWKRDVPEYFRRIRKINRFPHEIPVNGMNGIVFERDRNGVHRNFSGSLPVKYTAGPPGHGLYFRIYPILVEMLALYDHSFVPEGLSEWEVGRLPPEWRSPPLDYSARFNRIAALLESIVSVLASVNQRSMFRIQYRAVEKTPDSIVICGEAHPNVRIWDGVEIREVFRRVRIGYGADPLWNDEFYFGIRNPKGQGGYGRIELKMIP